MPPLKGLGWGRLRGAEAPLFHVIAGPWRWLSARVVARPSPSELVARLRPDTPGPPGQPRTAVPT
jgi:hypothetical protein